MRKKYKSIEDIPNRKSNDYTFRDANTISKVRGKLIIAKDGDNVYTDYYDEINIMPYYDRQSKSIMIPLIIKNTICETFVTKVPISRDIIMKCIQDEE